MHSAPTIITAIRVHRQQSNRDTLFDPSPVRAAVERALEYSESVVLAASLHQADLEALLNILPASTFLHADRQEGETPTIRVHVLPFTSVTYGRFVPALNALVAFAQTRGFERLLFQSVEVLVGKDQVEKMADLCRDDTLVVGKAFFEHDFQPPNSDVDPQATLVSLTGRTCPWNTFALWNVRKLARTGFLLTSETNTPPNASAIEEAPTIALHQHLFPGQSHALLVRFKVAEDEWGTSWADPARREWHASKLASKDTSAASHIANIGLAGSKTIVKHVQIL